MNKLLLTAFISLTAYTANASIATATNLVRSGNLDAALTEINQALAPEQKKIDLFNSIIERWNPTQQPELAERIRKVARGNLSIIPFREVNKRLGERIATAPAAPARVQIPAEIPVPSAPYSPKVPPALPVSGDIIDIALHDPNIPTDIQKPLNDLAPNQREQVVQALNNAQSASQWQLTGAALIGGLGAAGLRWLWDWYHNAQPAGGPNPPGGPQSPKKDKGQLSGDKGQPGPKEAKEKEEKEKEENVQATEGPITHTPEFAQYVEKYKNSIVTNGYPKTIQKYLAAINAQPQTFDNLLTANKQLIHLEQTLSFKSIQDVLAASPAIQKQLIEYDLYPAKELYQKEQELLDGYMTWAQHELTSIEKPLEALVNQIENAGLAEGERAKSLKELAAALTKLREADAAFQTPYGIATANTKQRHALTAQLKKMANTISRLTKSAGE